VSEHAGVLLLVNKFRVDVLSLLRLLQREFAQLFDGSVQLFFANGHELSLVRLLFPGPICHKQLSSEFDYLLVFQLEQHIKLFNLSFDDVDLVSLLADLDVLHEVVQLVPVHQVVLVNSGLKARKWR
jgi:hypothetical protein